MAKLAWVSEKWPGLQHFPDFNDLNRFFLIQALAETIWCAASCEGLPKEGLVTVAEGVDCKATVLLTNPNGSWSVGTATTLDEVIELLAIHQFDIYSYGLLNLLLSVYITARERHAVDDFRPLLGTNGYGEQTLHSLLICGWFTYTLQDEPERKVDPSKPDTMTKKTPRSGYRGIPRKMDIGFLTVKDAATMLGLGSYFRQPGLPVWVLLSDMHYSVLIAKDVDLLMTEQGALDQKRKWRLFYLRLWGSRATLEMTLAGKQPKLPVRYIHVLKCLRTQFPTCTLRLVQGDLESGWTETAEAVDESSLLVSLKTTGKKVTEEPTVKPTEPTVKPTEPGVNPTEPGVNPTEPGVNPTEPGVNPADPSGDPAEPSASSTYVSATTKSDAKSPPESYEPTDNSESLVDMNFSG